MNEEHYGIMHGDMHEGNYLIDMKNDFKTTFFDWDLTSKAWYMIDVGSFVIHRMFMPLLTGATAEET